MDLLQRLQQTYQKLLADGKLLSEDKLKESYAAFHSKFNPTKLKSIDGELLAETLFNHGNKGSLVYWLEFKSDDEFQTGQFGGIGGGSAFKFGIYKRKEDGKWITGSPAKGPVEVSVDEAVKIVREKRDLLVRGAEIIEALPNNAKEADYNELQNKLDTEIKGLANNGWVHKYYHMLYPSKIDDYHSPDWQKFYLIKMFKKPISTEGRYALAGQYMELSRLANLPISHVTTAMYNMFGDINTYWRVGTTGSKDHSYWDEMYDGGFVSIGWSALGDLKKFDNMNPTEAKAQLKSALEDKYPNDPRQIGKSVNQILNFTRYIKKGDIIVAAKGEIALGIGRVTGEYEFNGKFDFPHHLKVEWLKTPNKKLAKPSEGLQTTVHQLKDFDNLIEIEKLLEAKENTPITPETRIKLDPLTGTTALVEGILARKKQVILYGPPGTGKTFHAERACYELAARSFFHQSYSTLNDIQRRIITGDKEAMGLVRFCCFHPSYGYEDFIEGIKPSVTDGKTLFELKDGIFKKLCIDATNVPSQNYYLIIDEINRGDISRIFGELISIVEAGKRGKEVLLPLSGSMFSVPENVYLVGTMNTADRSIALLDVALRRRFGFVELMPDYNLLSGISFEGLPLGEWLKELNNSICEHIGQDARNLQIGHSYFLDKEKAITNINKFSRIVREEIIPLIEEYCYGDYTSIVKILGNGIVDTKNRTIKNELFNPQRVSDLVNALLEPWPSLKTSVSVSQQEVDQPAEQEEDGLDAEEQ